MQLDERGTLAVVSHPGHEFLGIGARIGGELVAGVAGREGEGLQADSSQGGEPDTAAEVGVRQW